MKKTLGLLLIAVGFLFLSGCGSKQESQSLGTKETPKIALILGFGGVDDVVEL